MEKIIIAPGESGDFNNWGKDFLEEKAFLEKFSCSYAAALMILKMKCVGKKKVTKEEIENLTSSKRNVVQSTLHFQNILDNMFSIMKNDLFDASKNKYHEDHQYQRN